MDEAVPAAYGVEIGTLRYNDPALNGYRGRASSHGGAHAGKWPVSVNTGEVVAAVLVPGSRVEHGRSAGLGARG